MNKLENVLYQENLLPITEKNIDYADEIVSAAIENGELSAEDLIESVNDIAANGDPNHLLVLVGERTRTLLAFRNLDPGRCKLGHLAYAMGMAGCSKMSKNNEPADAIQEKWRTWSDRAQYEKQKHAFLVRLCDLYVHVPPGKPGGLRARERSGRRLEI